MSADWSIVSFPRKYIINRPCVLDRICFSPLDSHIWWLNLYMPINQGTHHHVSRSPGILPWPEFYWSWRITMRPFLQQPLQCRQKTKTELQYNIHYNSSTISNDYHNIDQFVVHNSSFKKLLNRYKCCTVIALTPDLTPKPRKSTVGALFTSHSHTIHNSQLQKTIALRTQPRKQVAKEYHRRHNSENLVTNHYCSLDAATPTLFTRSSCKRQ